MLRIVNLEEIQNQLLQIPVIVELGERGDFGFVSSVKRWLIQMEQILKNNKLCVSANVAGLRAMVISAELGTIPVGINFKGRVTKRKVREAVASQSITSAVDIVSDRIGKDIERIEDAERITRQLISIAKRKGLIAELPRGNNFSDALKSIWKSMSADPVLVQGLTSVEGLVGPHDALILLDRAIVADKEKN
ncbi:MAG: hypothetical protein IAX21_01560 [Candidatus Bathyarchaeota archaeon]|nr:hypothetical protein [Candidatus Bathyarchaeum tardum]WGM90336.1 MAG: hypothetical protein NUK63_04235 [Candidatus Bathyarchaeum tardum]WNZ29585.1 MAG: hypothetical protein IAX21_01560 [Candidatus Bathyarchaeota archaeon]